MKLKELEEQALKKFIEDSDKLNISAIKSKTPFRKRKFRHEGRTATNTQNDASIASFVKEYKQINFSKRYSQEKSGLPKEKKYDPTPKLNLEKMLGEDDSDVGYLEESDDLGDKNESYFGYSEDEEGPKDQNSVRLLEDAAELEDILSGKMLNAFDLKYKIRLIQVELNQKAEEVIEHAYLNVILRAIYKQLHRALLEVNDQFCEERRKVFELNFKDYLKVIDEYMNKKDELFQTIVSGILNQLDLNMEILDRSLNYSLETSSNHGQAAQVRENWDKIYSAGIK